MQYIPTITAHGVWGAAGTPYIVFSVRLHRHNITSVYTYFGMSYYSVNHLVSFNLYTRNGVYTGIV